MGGSGTPGLFLGQDHGTNTDYLYDDNANLTKKDDGTNTHE